MKTQQVSKAIFSKNNKSISSICFHTERLALHSLVCKTTNQNDSRSVQKYDDATK